MLVTTLAKATSALVLGRSTATTITNEILVLVRHQVHMVHMRLITAGGQHPTTTVLVRLAIAVRVKAVVTLARQIQVARETDAAIRLHTVDRLAAALA